MDDSSSADVAALRRQIEADRARDLERQQLLELVRVEQTRLATRTQRQIDMLLMKIELEQERLQDLTPRLFTPRLALVMSKTIRKL